MREINLCPLECDLVYGLRLTDCHIMRCWETLMSRSDYSQRSQEVEQYNKLVSDTNINQEKFTIVIINKYDYKAVVLSGILK